MNIQTQIEKIQFALDELRAEIDKQPALRPGQYVIVSSRIGERLERIKAVNNHLIEYEPCRGNSGSTHSEWQGWVRPATTEEVIEFTRAEAYDKGFKAGMKASKKEYSDVIII